MSNKTAVLLMNLGGPDQESSIKPFLYNFFMDPNIIGAPKFIRYFIAKWIAFSRGNGAALESYSHLGGKSPILENTNAQADALKKHLKTNGYDDLDVYVSMRYWHPRASQVVKEFKEKGYTRVLLIPLYPQFSTTTAFSSMQEFTREAKKQNLKIDIQRACCYPTLPGFIQASAERVRDAISKAPKNTRVLFSAHGLPEKIIEGGDPYQHQCEETARAIVYALNIENLDWQICYQSRVGPLKWIGPSTEEALEKAAHDGVGVIIYPHAFVSEHVETLVEIEIEYREMAEEMGVSYLGKAETVGTHPAFIEGLADIVKNMLEYKKYPTERICPKTFKRCGQNCSYD